MVSRLGTGAGRAVGRLAGARLRRALRAAGTAITAVAATVGATAGCELAEVTVPTPARGLVVHAVLNPDADEQVVLLEAVLTGRVALDDSSRLDPMDPIASRGGEPVSGAVVRLLADNDSVGVTAVETPLPAGVAAARGTGRYAVPRERLAVQPGGRYRLHIRTADGREVTGETRVPGPIPGWVPGSGSVAPPVTLDRATDTLRLDWGAVPGALRYAIRVDTPRGPWFLIADSTRFRLAGGLRNPFVGGLPSVWYPGFRQVASVGAIDRNFYDYNRSGNDPWGGAGLISSVRGAIGLFGSIVPLLRREVTVRQAPRVPFDARWRGRTPAGAPFDLELWVETPGPDISTVSGRVADGADQFVLGTLQGDAVRLAFLDPARLDTLALFTGRVAGDSISGDYSPRFGTSGPRGWRR